MYEKCEAEYSFCPTQNQIIMYFSLFFGFYFFLANALISFWVGIALTWFIGWYLSEDSPIGQCFGGLSCAVAWNTSVQHHEVEYKHTSFLLVCWSVQTVGECTHGLVSELRDTSFLHSPHSHVSEGVCVSQACCCNPDTPLWCIPYTGHEHSSSHHLWALIIVCLQVLATYLQTEIDLFVFLIPIHSSKNNGGGVWLDFLCVRIK